MEKKREKKMETSMESAVARSFGFRVEVGGSRLKGTHRGSRDPLRKRHLEKIIDVCLGIF